MPASRGPEDGGTVRELHVVAVSEDGRHVLLAGRRGTTTGSYRVALDDRLLAAVRGDLPRPGEDPTAAPALSPKEIQARLRAGESAADIARSAGVPVTRVERFSGPVQGEMAGVIAAARAAHLVRGRLGRSVLPLGRAVDRALEEAPGLRPDSIDWQTRREPEGHWLVTVEWFSRARMRSASWRYDPSTRAVTAVDPAAAALAHTVEEEETPRRRATSDKATASTKASPATKRPAAKKAPGGKKAAGKPTAARPTGGRTSTAPAPAGKKPSKTPVSKPAARTAAPAAAATRRPAAKAPATKVPVRKAPVRKAAGTKAPVTKAPAIAATRKPAKASAKAAAARAVTAKAATPVTAKSRAKSPAKGARAASKAPATSPTKAASTATTSSRAATTSATSAAARRPGATPRRTLRVVPDAEPRTTTKPVTAGDRDGVRSRASVPAWADVLLGTTPGADR